MTLPVRTVVISPRTLFGGKRIGSPRLVSTRIASPQPSNAQTSQPTELSAKRSPPKLQFSGNPRSRSPQSPKSPPIKKQTRIVQGHLVALRDEVDRGTSPKHVTDQKISSKGFGEKLGKTKQSVGSWGVRQLDWYNSERRLIFAVDPLSAAYQKIFQGKDAIDGKAFSMLDFIMQIKKPEDLTKWSPISLQDAELLSQYL